MEKRDYLQRQFEELGEVIGRLLHQVAHGNLPPAVIEEKAVELEKELEAIGLASFFSEPDFKKIKAAIDKLPNEVVEGLGQLANALALQKQSGEAELAGKLKKLNTDLEAYLLNERKYFKLF